jgi:hypothetical protein
MMLDKIKEAKQHGHGIVFENYQPPNITWEDVLNFLYKESITPNYDLENKVKQHNNDDFISIGNVQIQSKFWLAPQTSNIFKEFEGVSELLYNLNNEQEDTTCDYYKNMSHTCSLDWHFQGIRVSLSNRIVSDHHDPHDIFYWQIVGTSFWKIDNGITYTLNPGDLLYLPLENSHEVWCDGPRAGLLIDNLNS